MGNMLRNIILPSGRALILALVWFLAITGPAQTLPPGIWSTVAPRSVNRSAAEEVFANLLDFPSPPPVSAGASDKDEPDDRPASFYDPQNPPPDDAADTDLAAYWVRMGQASGIYPPRPTGRVRERLLILCETDPTWLYGLLPALPEDAEAAARVTKIFQAAPKTEDFDDDWRERVQKWLKFHSAAYVGELVEPATRVRDHGGQVENAEALVALARVDRRRARPLVEAYLNGDQPRTAALAATIFYRWATSDHDTVAEALYRARLIAIADDRAAPGWARNEAVEELLETEWLGRDDWYREKLGDDSLTSLHDPPFGFNPLAVHFVRAPERWLPAMAQLVESRDHAVRTNAASCLVSFTNSSAVRREAVLPLLPWLAEPDRFDLNDTERTWFIQKLDRIEVPESVPGLIWVIQNEKRNRKSAAQVLAHYRDARALPALQQALAETTTEDERISLVQALVASGGVSADEQIAAIEAYAAASGRSEVLYYGPGSATSLPFPLVVGWTLSREHEVAEGVIRGVFARADAVRSDNRNLSDVMLKVAQQWNSQLVDRDLIRRIGNGTAPATLIEEGLHRREKLAQTVPEGLRALSATPGFPAGIVAVILNDDARLQKILQSDDQAAQIGLLACARLLRLSVPVAEVGPLLKSRSELLVLAAQKYLLADDSAEARRILTDHFSEQAFITGWRENDWQPFEDPVPPLDDVEAGLRQELFQPGNAPREIFAALDNEERANHIVRVYRNRAVYSWYEEGTGYRSRTLTAAALEQFRSSVAASKLPDSGPIFDYCHHDCTGAEFLNLTRAGGRRVFSYQSRSAWEETLEKFTALAGK
jgi:hypothetical protein